MYPDFLLLPNEGDSGNLIVKGDYYGEVQGGLPDVFGLKVWFRSIDPSVASVDEQGVVTADKPGETILIAAYDKREAEVRVVVGDTPASTFEDFPHSYAMFPDAAPLPLNSALITLEGRRLNRKTLSEIEQTHGLNTLALFPDSVMALVSFDGNSLEELAAMFRRFYWDEHIVSWIPNPLGTFGHDPGEIALPVELLAIVHEPAEFAFDDVGQSIHIKVSAIYTDGTTQTLGIEEMGHLLYAIDDPDIAGMGPDGLLTALTPGSSVLTIRYADVSTEMPVTVLTPPYGTDPELAPVKLLVDASNAIALNRLEVRLVGQKFSHRRASAIAGKYDVSIIGKIHDLPAFLVEFDSDSLDDLIVKSTALLNDPEVRFVSYHSMTPDAETLRPETPTPTPTVVPTPTVAPMPTPRPDGLIRIYSRPASIVMKAGDLAFPDVRGVFSDGSDARLGPGEDVEVSFHSTAGDVARVSEAGVITAMSVGTSVVVAHNGDKSAQIRVTVESEATPDNSLFPERWVWAADSLVFKLNHLMVTFEGESYDPDRTRAVAYDHGVHILYEVPTLNRAVVEFDAHTIDDLETTRRLMADDERTDTSLVIELVPSEWNQRGAVTE